MLGLASRRSLGGAAIAAPALAQNEQFIPHPGLPHRRLCAERHPVRQRHRRLLQAGQRARRRHQRRQDRLGGMRDRLRHRPRRRVLRAAEGQGPDRRRLRQPAVDRHHLRAHREGAGRQDPDDHDGLRPLGVARRPVFQWIFPLLGTYWTAADIILQHIAKKEGGVDKLKGKKIALVYHDSPYGKEPIPLLQKRAQKHGFELHAAAGHAARRRAEGDLAADPPEPARLRAALGLGRDELDRAQGGGRRRLSARQDVRRLVGRRRAGRACRPETAPRATTRSRCSTPPASFKVHEDIKKYVYDKGQGTGEDGRRPARSSTSAA